MHNRNATNIVYFHGYNRGRSWGVRNLTTGTEELNFIFIQDRDGWNRYGSGFIGKSITEAQYIILVNKLIEFLRLSIGIDRLIFAGSSMGGYGCLLHSLFNDVDEVYATVAQTSLNPSLRYYNVNKQQQFLENPHEPGIFSLAKYIKKLGIIDLESFMRLRELYPFIDIPYAINLLYERKKISILFKIGSQFCEQIMYFPAAYYHLTNARFDHPRDVSSWYLNEFTLPLMKSFNDSRIMYSQVILPIVGHDHYIEPNFMANFSDKHREYTELSIDRINRDLDENNIKYIQSAEELRRKGSFQNLLKLNW